MAVSLKSNPLTAPLNSKKTFLKQLKRSTGQPTRRSLEQFGYSRRNSSLRDRGDLVPV
jgi:hypothetical protein